MSNKVHTTIDGLKDEIMKYLKEYKEDIDDDVKELVDKNIKEATKELRSISPKAKKRVYLRKWKTQNESDWQEPGSYAKSWTYVKGENAKEIYSKIAKNRGYYRLTHLLEFGHANRDGSRTAPIPHIRKTEDKYREKFIQELEQKIRRQ